MCACVCVSMCSCVCACVCVCVCACMCVCVCMHVCVCAWESMCTCVCVCVCVWRWREGDVNETFVCCASGTLRLFVWLFVVHTLGWIEKGRSKTSLLFWKGFRAYSSPYSWPVAVLIYVFFLCPLPPKKNTKKPSNPKQRRKKNREAENKAFQSRRQAEIEYKL